MMRSTFPTSDQTIRRLRRQINEEDDRGKLKDLVIRLDIALHEERPKTRVIPTPVKQGKNPFDAVIF